MDSSHLTRVMRVVKPLVGHRIREARVHFDRWTQVTGSPRLTILPSGPLSDGASYLRAYLIGQSLKRSGWRVTYVPAQLELCQRLRITRRERPDIILMQQARHPLNRPSYYGSIPIVFDIDDADFLDPSVVHNVRECCEGSHAVIAGSRFVAAWCRRHNPHVEVVWTCTPVRRCLQKPPARHSEVVAWAHSSPARSPREAQLVRDIVKGVADRRPLEFWLYGINDRAEYESQGVLLNHPKIRLRTFQYMRYAHFLNTLQGVTVGLAPICAETPFSRGKSFGKVLGYLSSNVAIVASRSVDYPLFFTHGVNAILANKLEDWIDGITMLLERGDIRQSLAERAFDDFRRRLSTQQGARRVDRVLRGVLEGPA